MAVGWDGELLPFFFFFVVVVVVAEDGAGAGGCRGGGADGSLTAWVVRLGLWLM